MAGTVWPPADRQTGRHAIMAYPNDMAKILVIVQHLYLRDPRVRRATLELTQAGYAVDVICLTTRRHSWIRRAEADGARLYYLPVQLRLAGPWRYAWEYGSFGLMALLLAAYFQLRR